MAYLLPGLRRSLLLTSPILLSAPLLIHSYNRPIHCDAPLAFSNPFGTDVRPSAHHTQTSTTSTSKSTSALNPRVVRQISMGSILGVLGGLGISVFSKPLAVLIGLGVVLVQFLASRGINLIPYSFIQNRVQQANVRSLILNNPAFKFSFGMTFALAAFAQF